MTAINIIGPLVVWLIVHLHPWAPIVIGAVGLGVLVRDMREFLNRVNPRRSPDGLPVRMED